MPSLGPSRALTEGYQHEQTEGGGQRPPQRVGAKRDGRQASRRGASGRYCEAEGVRAGMPPWANMIGFHDKLAHLYLSMAGLGQPGCAAPSRGTGSGILLA